MHFTTRSILCLVLLCTMMQKNNGGEIPSSSNSPNNINSSINSNKDDLAQIVSSNQSKFIQNPSHKKIIASYLSQFNRPALDPNIVKIACDYAPTEVKTIIKMLKNYPEEAARQYLFIGDTGIGKTTLAQAIAQEIDWSYIFVPVAELPNTYQNSVAVGLKQIIDPIITQSNERYVILLDEFIQAIDNNSDGAAISSILDKCANQPNIIVIGTAPDACSLPSKIKRRLGSGIIKFPLPSWKARKALLNFLFNEQIRKQYIKKEYIDEPYMGCRAIAEQYLDSLANATKGKSLGDITKFFKEALSTSLAENRKIIDVIAEMLPAISQNHSTLKNSISSHLAQFKNSALEQYEVDIACDHAPAEVKRIFNVLNNKEILSRRLYLFVGAPGVGKTTLAQAIAQKIGNPIFIRVSKLPDEYQNSAGAGLRRIIDPLLQYEKNKEQSTKDDSEYIEESEKYVIILDEITHITDNYQQKNNINNDAATTVWSLLDDCDDLENIIVIGTTNNESDLPPQLKSRLGKNGIVKIDLPSYQAREKLLRSLLKKQIEDGTINDQYIEFLANKTNGKSFRDIMDSFNLAKDMANEREVNREITKEDIDAILHQWKSWWHPVELYGSYAPFLKNHITPSNIHTLAGLCISVGQLSLQQSSYNLQKSLADEQKKSIWDTIKDIVYVGGSLIGSGKIIYDVWPKS